MIVNRSFFVDDKSETFGLFAFITVKISFKNGIQFLQSLFLLFNKTNLHVSYLLKLDPNK